MRISKGLVIGIVGALLAGGVEAGTEWAVNTSAAGESSSERLTVPSGAIGDTVLYVQYAQDEAGSWTRETEWGFTIGEPAEQIDRTGTPRAALPVLMHRTSSMPTEFGILGLEGTLEQAQTYVWVTDLETQDTLAYHFDTEFSATTAVDSFTGGAGRTEFGPFPPRTGLRDINLRSSNFLHADRTYTLGQALDVDEWLSYRPFFYHFFSNQRAQITIHESSGSVAQAGRVGERDALALDYRACMTIRDETNPLAMQAYVPGVVLPADFCFSQRRWVSADVAYPILIEQRVEAEDANGTRTLDLWTSMAKFEAGTQPIPWPSGAGKPFTAENPALERADRPAFQPADGTGIALAYPLSRAVREVGSDPTLAAFSLWKLQHPNALLIGGNLRPVGADAAAPLWSLTYATPQGDAFVVGTRLAPGESTPRNSEHGNFTVPPFDAADLVPARPGLTIAAAHELWYLSGNGRELPEPNFLNWGAYYTATWVACGSGICAAGPAKLFFSVPDFTEYIVLGYIPNADQDGRVGVTTDAQQWAHQQALVETGRGHVIWANHAAYDWQAAPLAAPMDYERVEPSLVESPGSVPAPNLARAATVSGSLLMIFLLAYFLPVLKFAGTQGLMLFPGYAKLHKDDILNNKPREAMLNAIRADPGITPQELRRVAGIGWGTTVYHLGVLEKNKLVSALVDGRHKRFFPTDKVPWSQRDQLAALKNVRTKQLYELIMSEPGVDTSGAAKRLGISRPALYFHVHRLESTRLVGKDLDGRRVRYFPLQEGLPVDPRTAVEVA